ncbi:hypothetical protein QUV83_16760 [Cellulomonas cellasea]|uniref:hypothetical protein n=1 Tax=Cellulomonas cellasea TaxID=43670 RepID=UPI0025A3C75D|nr:hypothetical protein [Cellulomonas cellasea]MDM8086425.1 hypothetical protein [Cellulomonas cellasea]
MTTFAPAPPARPRSNLDHGAYRTWLRTGVGPGWVDRAVDQLGAWLRGKDRRLDVDLSSDGVHLVAGKTLTVRRHNKGGQDAFRFTMAEGPVGRRYTTTVMFVGGRSGGWMSLQGTNESGQWVDTPNLATYLLDSPGNFTDGDRIVSPELWHVRTTEERFALLDLLVSDRRGAVFVAAAGHQDPGLAVDFARKVEEWTKGARGLAHVAFLDHESAAWLREQVGGTLGVAEWTVRTFRPGIDLTSPATLRLHRTMGMSALIDTSEHRLRRLFSMFARQLLDEQPEPTEVVAWRRTFERLDSREAADGLRRVAERADATRRRVEQSRSLFAAQRAAQAVEPPAIAVPPASTAPVTGESAPAAVDPAELEGLRGERAAAAAERDALLDTLRRVQETLMLPDLTEDSLTALLDAATATDQDQDAAAAGAARIETLEEQVADLEAKVAEHQDAEWAARQEAVDTQGQVSSLDETLRQLSRQVAVMTAGGDPADVAEAPLDCPSAEAPGSWQELVDGFETWEALGIVITADHDTAADLHDIDVDGRCLANTWRGLTALAGYVRAKREGAHDGGFKTYLEAQPSGYPRYNQGWFATSETSNAMTGERAKERDLPVPKSVHRDGVLEMQQHLRIGRIPNLDPRVYIHDDTTETGVVVVGYIGPHLTTRATAKLNR